MDASTITKMIQDSTNCEYTNKVSSAYYYHLYYNTYNRPKCHEYECPPADPNAGMYYLCTVRGQSINFTDLTTYAPIMTINWGDGTSSTHRSGPICHCYNDCGVYRVYVSITNIVRIDCHDSSGSLQFLNVSPFTTLNSLICSNCGLNELNVGGLTELRTLDCGNNNISSLSVGGLINLTYLHCGNNIISSLSVGGLINLTYLDCVGNNISELSVGGLTNLTYLDCGCNNISVLTVDNLIKLTVLICQENKITQLAVTNLVNLIILKTNSSSQAGGCNNYDNTIDTLDIQYLTKLTTLICGPTSVNASYVSNFIDLTELGLIDVSLNALDVSRLVKLSCLDLERNNLQSLDVSTLVNLAGLIIGTNNVDTPAIDSIILALSQHSVQNGTLYIGSNPGYPPTQNAAYNHLVNDLKWSIY